MNAASINSSDYAVAVLAGGRGNRLGGADKGLLPAGGQTAVERVLASVPTTVPRVIIANRNLARYQSLGLPVRQDPWPDFRGPLAGMLAALHATSTPWVQMLPCDALSLPPGMSSILLCAAEAAATPAAFPLYGNRGQYACCMLHRDLTLPLEQALDAGERRAGRWLSSTGAVSVDMDILHPSPIWSANTADEWRSACHRIFATTSSRST
ncbi:NTP transferase domain-containing protein [Proteobacteria bacterium 005FR1]|nr:NTP transferase domain-containing protein [Proteobacteria bacterium 005FR1]